MKEQLDHTEVSGVRIQLPEAELMREKLKGVGLYKENPGTDAFFDTFINQIAGTQKVASGIVLAYEQTIFAITDTCLPQDFPLVLDYYRGFFDRVADAVIVKPRDAEETKYYMQHLQNNGKN